MRRATFCAAVLVTALAPALALAPTPTSPRRTVPLRAHTLEPPRANDAISAAPSSEVVRVELGDRAYDIVIGDGVLTADVAFAAALLRPHVKGAHVLVVSNVVVAPLYLNACVDALRYDGTLRVESLVLPDGEATKSLENLALIVDEALAKSLDRKTTFVALGGGVIGDMVGFAAACYQRGVDFVQVPTTLMAMVDSSVGGKTAVNAPRGKNMIGAFYQPQLVLADTATLRSLPDRELRSGVAEAIKYGLIRDAPFFEWMEANVDRLLARDAEALAECVRRSCENKALVCAADEKEAGLRATLNLGHTFGHAIETEDGYGTWLHGEAVSIGTAMACDMSVRQGWIEPQLAQRAVKLLRRAECPVALTPDSGMTRASFAKHMALDKKVADGKLRLILLKGALGECVFTGDFDSQALDATIDLFCESNAREAFDPGATAAQKSNAAR